LNRSQIPVLELVNFVSGIRCIVHVDYHKLVLVASVNVGLDEGIKLAVVRATGKKAAPNKDNLCTNELVAFLIRKAGVDGRVVVGAISNNKEVLVEVHLDVAIDIRYGVQVMNGILESKINCSVVGIIDIFGNNIGHIGARLVGEYYFAK
jgi:hypothetical protein